MAENSELIEKICRILITNQKLMIQEKDIQNLCSSLTEYQTIMRSVITRLKKVGFRVIRSSFKDKKYLLVATLGKDPKLSPSLYGTLALILAYFNEFGDEIEVSEIQSTFKEVWTQIEVLIDEKYLTVEQRGKTKNLQVMPVSKAIFKDLLPKLTIDSLLQQLQEDGEEE